jgi:peptide/nickel transport system permease protein
MRLGRSEVLALSWLVLTLLVSILAPILAGEGPLQPVAVSLAAPNLRLPLGADALGRDLWARFVYGSRLSLGASFLAAGLTVLVGGLAGLVAAVLGGWADRAILWAANVLLAIPGLLLAMLVVASFGPGLPTVVLAVGVGGAPGFARLARTVFRQALQGAYIQAALALGAGRRWIAGHHLMPNALPQLASLATVQFAWSFLATTTLTFLGFSGDPSTPEWGAMLNAGRAHLVDAPRLALIPGVAISLTILAVHSLGSWLSRGRQPSATHT